MDKWSRVEGLTEETRAFLRRTEQVFGMSGEEPQMIGETDAPFEVTEEYQLPDLSEVKEDRYVMPPAQQVLFTISKATLDKGLVNNKEPESSTNQVIKRSLALEVRIAEGIGEDGKFKNKPFFPRFLYWIDPTHEAHAKSEWYMKSTKPWMADLKLLLVALGYDIAQPPKLNDAFLSAITGTQVRANIIVKKVQSKDESGVWRDTGEMDNALKGWKAA